MPLNQNAKNHVADVIAVATTLQQAVHGGSNKNLPDGNTLIAAAITCHAIRQEGDATALRAAIREVKQEILNAGYTIANRR